MDNQKYNEICEMWSKATKKVVAPQGFKDECESYIDNTMADELKTDKFFIFDDKYNTSIRYIERKPMICGRGNTLLVFNRDGKNRTIHDLDDEVLYSITKTIYEFVSSYNFDFVSCRDDEKYGYVPTRKVDELLVEPILNENIIDDYVDDNGVYHCGMGSFYQTADDAMIKHISYRFDLVKKMFEDYIDHSHQFITKKLNFTQKTLRSIAFYYLYRELENTNNYEYEFPCGDTKFEVQSVPTDIGDKAEFENARLDNIHSCADGTIIFTFSNGREEEMNEVFIDCLWQVLYSIEYNKHPHYESIEKLGSEIKVNTPTDYVEKAEKYIYHVIYNVFKSSRLGYYVGQRFMLMSKYNTPMGFLYDVVCKRSKVIIEYYTSTRSSNPFDMCFNIDENEEEVESVDLEDLSPISIKHLVTYVGYGYGLDEATNEDYSYIHAYEEWSDIVGVRVPYRIVRGEKVTFNTTFEDEEMTTLARRAGIHKKVDDDTFLKILGSDNIVAHTAE